MARRFRASRGRAPRLDRRLAKNDRREDLGPHELVDPLQTPAFRATLRANAAPVLQEKSEVVSKLVHSREFIVRPRKAGYQLHPKLALPIHSPLAHRSRRWAGNSQSPVTIHGAPTRPAASQIARCRSGPRRPARRPRTHAFRGLRRGLRRRRAYEHRCVGPPSEAAHPKYRPGNSARRLCAQFADES